MCWDTGLAAAYSEVSACTRGLCLEGYALLLGLVGLCSLITIAHYWVPSILLDRGFSHVSLLPHQILFVCLLPMPMLFCRQNLLGASSPAVLVCFSVAVTKHWSKPTPGQKGFIWPTDYSHHRGKSGQRFKARTWKQELKQRPWRIIACWLSPQDMLGLSTTNRTTFQGGTVSSLLEAVFHGILLLWRDTITRTTVIEESI